MAEAVQADDRAIDDAMDDASRPFMGSHCHQQPISNPVTRPRSSQHLSDASITMGKSRETSQCPRRAWYDSRLRDVRQHSPLRTPPGHTSVFLSPPPPPHPPARAIQSQPTVDPSFRRLPVLLDRPRRDQPRAQDGSNRRLWCHPRTHRQRNTNDSQPISGSRFSVLDHSTCSHRPTRFKPLRYEAHGGVRHRQR